MYNPKLHFHFTGIGGSGMSGIAEVLLDLGFQVSGSDLCISSICEHLKSLGAEIYEGHAPEHIPETSSLLVYSSAVKLDNPELIEAKRRGIPVVRRAEVLAELVRLKFSVTVAGSHGKTTTTSIIAAILEKGGLDPTVIIGGQLKSIGSGAKLGKGAYLVAESDESDRSFLLLKPTIAVVTNIDSEHMEAYSSFEDLENSFEKFVGAVPFYGLSVLCIDDPKVRALAEKCKGRKRTYGFSPDAQVRAENVVQKKNITSYDVLYRGDKLCRIDLALPGRHVLLNSLAAISVGIEFGIDIETIRKSLSSFTGVERRLEISAEVNGVTIINDYGHHPTEIRATLAAIREGWKDDIASLHVIFQPHRYTRTRDCFDRFLNAFRDCDALYISDIHAASEEPIAGVSAERLASKIDHPNVQYIGELNNIHEILLPQLKPGDLVLCLGAGSIGQLPKALEQELKG